MTLLLKGPSLVSALQLLLLQLSVVESAHHAGLLEPRLQGRHPNGTIICPQDPYNQPFPDCRLRDDWLFEDWVCGSDGVTYANECYLEAAFCDGINVTKVHGGKCEAPPCGTPCPEYFLPVCGIGSGLGHTYDSPCEFEQAKACEGIDAKMVAGRCGCRGRTVPMDYPVCGSDGRTYDNPWILERASRCGAKDLYMVAHGACERPACDAECPDKGPVVCGSDNREYRNICELKRGNACANRDYENEDYENEDYENEVYMKREGKCPPIWTPPLPLPASDGREFE